MQTSVILAEGIEVYRGYTIERKHGRYSIPYLSREGVHTSFGNPQLTRFVIDALITGSCIQQCDCDFLAIAPADTIGHFIARHRNKCGPGKIFRKIA